MGKSIQIKDLSFGYGDQSILKKLNVMIGHRTFLSIIGPNGSGKTTLLKNIARNLTPNQGSIFIDEKKLTTYSTADLAKDMAVVHQNPDAGVDFTVYDVVMMGRHPYISRFKRETDQDVSIVEQALKATNIFHLQERFIDEISGGEKQRVMIAKALAQEPQILLLDEPTSFLDIHHQIEILDLLKKLNVEKSITVIAVIHDLNLAARYSDEVMLMHEGKVLALGTTDKVMTTERLQRAYDMNMIIDRNVYTGCLQISPISVTKKNRVTRISVHVIGGGGIAKEVLQRCYRENIHLSLGVVNKGDSDAELGKKLNVEIVEEEPFCDITDDVLEKACLLADNAHYVILTSIPIGRGNLRNLLLAKSQLIKGKTVFLWNTYVDATPYDYVGGEGKKLLDELRTLGLKEYKNLDDIMDEIQQSEGV